MGKIITKRDRIKNILNSYELCHPLRVYGPFDEKRLALQKLDLDTVTEAEITKIMGNNSHTILICDECEKDLDKLIVFDTTNDYHEENHIFQVCKECLIKAVKEFDFNQGE